MSIVIIENSADDLLILSAIVKEIGFPYTACNSGRAALEHLASDNQRPDLVLTDVFMPDMDGYEVARHIKSLFPGTHIPIIFITASKEIPTLQQCLEIGDDFINKPILPEILVARISAHLRTSTLYKTLNNQAIELEKFRSKVDEELRIVDRIFENHLTSSSIGFPNLRMHMSAMSAFNGDVLLSALGPEGSFYIMIGDVTGHGLPAAVAAIPTYGAFRTMASKGLPVGTIAYEINNGLISAMPADMMMAALIMRIDNTGQEATVWSGGMPSMIVLDKYGALAQRIHATHAPLSMLPSDRFSRDIQHFNFDIGDRIYLFTDGIEEAESETGAMFGENEMIKTLTSAVDPFKSLLEAVDRFRSGEQQSDDVTLVEFTCQPLDLCLMEAQKPAPGSIIPWHFEAKLTVHHIRDIEPVPTLSKMLSAVKGLERHQDIISTVLSELYANALEHGLLKLDSAIKEQEDGFFHFYDLRKQRLSELENGWIYIAIDCYSGAENTAVYITVHDSGEGFSIEDVMKAQSSNRLSGRGIGLIKTLADGLEYSKNGTCARVHFRL